MIAIIAIIVRILCFLYSFTVILPRAWKFMLDKKNNARAIKTSLFLFVLFFNIWLFLLTWYQVGRLNPLYDYLSFDFMTMMNVIMQVITVVVFAILYI
jgi:hypothetical protein